LARQLTTKLLTELFAQNSGDPLLLLVTVDHPSFSTLYLVNNTEDIVSRGNTYISFPMSIRLSPDDGETARNVQISFDNVSLELIDEMRSVTSPMDVTIEAVLASDPDTVEIGFGELKLVNIRYDQKTIRGSLILDDFLRTELTSEKYTPTIYPGLFS